MFNDPNRSHPRLRKTLSRQAKFLVFDSGSGVFLLFHGPLHGPPDGIAEADQGFVSKSSPGLCDIVVTRHAAVGDALSVESRRLANDSKGNLAKEAEDETEISGEDPHALGAFRGTSSVPDGPHHVPEVDGRTIGNNERFAVNSLMVKRDCAAGGSDQ